MKTFYYRTGISKDRRQRGITVYDEGEELFDLFNNDITKSDTEVIREKLEKEGYSDFDIENCD